MPCSVRLGSRGYREQVVARDHNRWAHLPEGRVICLDVTPHEAQPQCSGLTTGPDGSTGQCSLSRSAWTEPGNRPQPPLDIFFRRPSGPGNCCMCARVSPATLAQGVRPKMLSRPCLAISFHTRAAFQGSARPAAGCANAGPRLTGFPHPSSSVSRFSPRHTHTPNHKYHSTMQTSGLRASLGIACGLRGSGCPGGW